MLRLTPSPSSISAGQVTFVVTNYGALNHEFLVVPIPSDGFGTRAVGSDGKINESQSLGEASTSRGAGPGHGISTGSRSWVTLTLRPGNYEVLCDVPWQYVDWIAWNVPGRERAVSTSLSNARWIEVSSAFAITLIMPAEQIARDWKDVASRAVTSSLWKAELT